MREPPATDKIQWSINYLEAYLQEALNEEERVFEQLNRSIIRDATIVLSLLKKYHSATRYVRE